MAKKIDTVTMAVGYPDPGIPGIALLLIASYIPEGNRGGPCRWRADGELMEWARLLVYITRTLDQELLLRKEYLAAENRILMGQLKQLHRNINLLQFRFDRLSFSETASVCIAPRAVGRARRIDLCRPALRRSNSVRQQDCLHGEVR